MPRWSAPSSEPYLSLPAYAQQTSSIAGIVRDTSGAVLPGVTVEATSPVLIEKIRTVVSDEQGRYNISDLLPGSYQVTFRLQGFSTVRREGITLTSGFTATVSVDLQVGSLEETITVSGASPIVDTSNVRRQTVASAELLATLPVSTKNIQSLVTLTPGWTGVADVGGRYTAEVGSFHGKRGIKVSFDSMVIENSDGNSSYQINSQAVSEMVAQTSGVTAEVNADGPVMNIIPRGGQQQVQRHRQLAVHQLEPREQQPQRRAAESRVHERQQDVSDLGSRRHESAARSCRTRSGSWRRRARGASRVRSPAPTGIRRRTSS